MGRNIPLEKVEEIILYFSTSLFGQNTVEEILWDLTRNCISQLGFVDCVVYLLDKDRKMLVQKAAYGNKNPVNYEIYHPIEIPVGRGVTGTVAVSGKPELIHDTSLDPRYIVDDENRLSELAVPLLYENEVIGVIDSEHPEKGFFTEQDLRILQTIASLCVNKIVKSQAQSQITENERMLSQFKIKAMQAQMNPHFVFNALNAIQYFITINDQANAMKYLSRFSKWIRRIIEVIDMDKVTLADEIEIVNFYLELELLRYNYKFDYEIEYDGIDPKNLFIPNLLIQPFVENAVQHGLINKMGQGKLTILYRMTGGFLYCTIVDDGVGRDESKRINNFKNGSELFNTMKLVDDRIRTFNESNGKKITYEVIDLVEGEVCKGTQVNLKIPIL